MSFLAPHWLWLLLAVAALVGAYVWVQLRGRQQAAVRFTNLALLASVAPRRPSWKRHLGAGLLAVALATMVVALARPTHRVRVARERAVVVMAVDVSVSMQSTDVEPTRLAAATTAAVDFAEALPDSVELGLVTFAGTANVAVSPTRDHAAVVRALDGLELQESTAIGEAVYTALDAVEAASAGEEGETAPAAVVLLSDGGTTVGRPTPEAAQVAADAEIPVSTIAFGTDEGIVVYQGQTVPVPVNRAELAELATITGGETHSAETVGELRDAYRDIGTTVGYTRERREATTAVLGAAVVLTLLAAAAALRFSGRLP